MQPAVDRIRLLCERGTITDLEREGNLQAADGELLEARPSATFLYPIDTQDRLLKLIRDAEGGVAGR